MYIFSSKIEISTECGLGGYGITNASACKKGGSLEVHGFGFDDSLTTTSWEVCSIDTLYAGELALHQIPNTPRRIFAASHTHYAPMLDKNKPSLGLYSEDTFQKFTTSIKTATRKNISPDNCIVMRSEVLIPVYRRFDFPASLFNRYLSKYAGAFPNDAHPVDKGVYLFLFRKGTDNLFCIVYHACHPVTRHDYCAVSADYVCAIREAVFQRFGTPHCLFFLGCAGDIRPNFTKKRVQWLPKSRLNWRFRYPPTEEQQKSADRQYRDAIGTADALTSFKLTELDFNCSSKNRSIEGRDEITIYEIAVGRKLIFTFLPFEVSHRFHLASQREEQAMKFIVSCSNDTIGYLPYPDQLSYGGYEVDGSRRDMGLQNRLLLKEIF